MGAELEVLTPTPLSDSLMSCGNLYFGCKYKYRMSFEGNIKHISKELAMCGVRMMDASMVDFYRTVW